MKTKTNPAFYTDELERWLVDDPGRLEQMLDNPDSVNLLVWNVFASLDTHSDPAWLAYRLQAFGGSGVRAPTRISLWTGRDREPLLHPSAGYVEAIRRQAAERGDTDEQIRSFLDPVEVPVRIESPDALVLVDAMLDSYPRGGGGRDRLAEVVDAGLVQARRLSKQLAVAVAYRSGSPAAADLSARINTLRDPQKLAAELPHTGPVDEVILREVPWQQLLRVWEQEVPYLRLSGQPVRGFLDFASRRGLR